MKKIRLFGIVFVLAFLFSLAAYNITTAPVTHAAVKSKTVVSYTAKVINCKKSVSVYLAPRSSATKLGKAAKGAVLTVIKANYSKKYHQVQYRGKVAYIQKAYSKLIKKTKKVTVPAKDKTTPASNNPAPTPAPSPSPSSESSPPPSSSPSPSPSASPSSGSNVYTIDNAQFGIDPAGKNARATTDGINRALAWAKENGYSKIEFAKGTYLIQCKWNNRYIAPTDGIMVPSGLALDLGSSTFVMEPNSYAAYCIFALVNQSDITITGGTLIGDLGKHTYAPAPGSSTHEWGFGIISSASKNVVIKGVTIKNMTGDGIILEGSYQSKANGGRESSAVKIFNCDISNCRRQGISVIGAPDSEIAGNKIYNISGTDPQYGIDVEPEFDYSVKNLKIHDNTIYGCTGGAITCCKGSGYEVYNNTCIKNHIIAAMSSNVKIYNNTIEDTFIRVMNGTSNVTAEGNIMKGNSWVFFG